MKIPSLEPSESANSLAREMDDEKRSRNIPCFVHHPDAGGQCERYATMFVYGLCLCEEHGEEARIGALEELYFDAQDVIERQNSTTEPLDNEEARHILSAMGDMLNDRVIDLDKAYDEALLKAYPQIPERVCIATRDYDYEVINDDLDPESRYREACHHLHAFMRQAYEKQMDWLVEILEIQRESTAAQASFALRDKERKLREIKAKREHSAGEKA